MKNFTLNMVKKPIIFPFLKPNIMVLEDNKKVIGVCRAVLKDINHKKYWYLCDFKINKDYRGQKLYRKLM